MTEPTQPQASGLLHDQTAPPCVFGISGFCCEEKPWNAPRSPPSPWSPQMTIWSIDWPLAQLLKTLALFSCFLSVYLIGIKMPFEETRTFVIHVVQTWSKGGRRASGHEIHYTTTKERDSSSNRANPRRLAANTDTSPFLIADSLDKWFHLRAAGQKPCEATDGPVRGPSDAVLLQLALPNLPVTWCWAALPRAMSPGGDGQCLQGEDSGTQCVPGSHLVLTIGCPDVPATHQHLCGAPPLVGCQSHSPSWSQLGREGNSSRADAVTWESAPGMNFSPAAMGCGSVTHFPTPVGCCSPCAKRWQHLHPTHRLLCR